jgi:epoxyqueuosine reductase
MRERLQRWARAKGYRVAAGRATLLAEAREDVAARIRRGEVDAQLAAKWFRGITESELPPDLGSRALIAVAVPCPAQWISFELPDAVVQARVPPTYGDDARMDQEVARELEALLPELGGMAPLRGPRKAVATRLGLTRYGRNNVTYAPGLGSYVLLCAMLSGAAPASRLPPAPGPAAMAACASCDACLAACPTGAIPRQRFLLNAERCLVAFNEVPGGWPPWLSASSHNCLVGCLACQEVCPANDGMLAVRNSGVRFDREETEAMLQEAPQPGVAPWPAIRDKLSVLGLEGYLPVIGRNLEALLKAKAVRRRP